MSEQDNIEEIFNHAVEDQEFRTKLIEDPVSAVREMGYELDDEQMEHLLSIGEGDVERLLAGVEDRISKSGVPPVVCVWG